MTLPNSRPPSDDPVLLNKRALAALLSVTSRTIEVYQRQGLPYYRLGPRRNRYDMAAVRSWLDRH